MFHRQEIQNELVSQCPNFPHALYRSLCLPGCTALLAATSSGVGSLLHLQRCPPALVLFTLGQYPCRCSSSSLVSASPAYPWSSDIVPSSCRRSVLTMSLNSPASAVDCSSTLAATCLTWNSGLISHPFLLISYSRSPSCTCAAVAYLVSDKSRKKSWCIPRALCLSVGVGIVCSTHPMRLRVWTGSPCTQVSPVSCPGLICV